MKNVTPVMITPDMAKEMLAKNTKNRRVSRATVRSYARDMAEGRWKFNGASIVISETGELVDGQHRLLACIQSNTTFAAYVLSGVDETIRSTIDAGRKRSAADALLLGGYVQSHAPGVAASARLVLNYLDGVGIHSVRSSAEIFDFVGEQPGLIEKHALGKPASKIMQASAMGAVLFLGTREPGRERWATEFVDAIVSGANLREDDPRLVLRNLFLNARARTQGANALPRLPWAFPAIVIGWNAWIAQEPTKVIRPVPSAQGSFKVPDVAGGPRYGSGVENFREGKISKKRIREIQEEERASREELIKAGRR